MSIKTNLSYLFNDYEWLCAWRENNGSILNATGKLYGFKVVNVSKGYWASDPFLFEKDNEYYLFVEYCDKKRNKCVLAVKKLYPNEEESFHYIYEYKYHTSYPCIFEWRGKKYIIPETKSARKIDLLECMTWPYEWRKKATLLENVDAADCTPVILEGKLHLLIYEENSKISTRLGVLDVENGYLSDIRNMRDYKQKVARPGGHMIYDGNKIICVRQPGVKFYGERLEFVDCNFDEEKSEEKIMNTIVPNQIVAGVDKKIIGVHTYNKCGNIEVIDLFTKKLNLIKPVIYLLHRLRIFGFGEYERDQKIVWKLCD